MFVRVSGVTRHSCLMSRRMRDQFVTGLDPIRGLIWADVSPEFPGRETDSVPMCLGCSLVRVRNFVGVDLTRSPNDGRSAA